MSNVYEIVSAQEHAFNNVLTNTEITWKKEYMFACQALSGNDALTKTALANQNSLVDAVINVASIGISLNPSQKHAYLVPRKGKVCLDISYQGLCHIAVQSGAVQWVEAKCVFTNDCYQNIAIDKAPLHKYDPFGDRGELMGVYCVAKLPNGDYLTEEMGIQELNKIRALGAQNGPWKNWFEQMSMKAVIKRASKRWVGQGNSALSNAVDYLNQTEGNEKDVTPPTNSETLNNLIEVDNSGLVKQLQECQTMEQLNEHVGVIQQMNDGDEKSKLKDLWLLQRTHIKSEATA